MIIAIVFVAGILVGIFISWAASRFDEGHRPPPP